MKKIMLFAVWFVLANQMAKTQPWPGEGTEQEPFQISTLQCLIALRDSVNINGNVIPWSANKHFKLMNHINDPLTNAIGHSGAVFLGHFDGNNFSIRLEINTSNSLQALFGYVSNSIIKNIIITGSVKTTGIIGNAAGIIGYAGSNVSIINCINFASIESTTNYIAGIVGSSNGVYISNCINLGTIKGVQHVGGIIGWVNADDAVISNCINAGYISGNNNVGGIVGWDIGGNGNGFITLDNCINTGVVVGNTNVGCIVGNGSPSLINCVWDKQMCPHK